MGLPLVSKKRGLTFLVIHLWYCIKCGHHFFNDDHSLRMPLSSFRRCQGPSPNGEIINCEAYGNAYNDLSAKRKKTSISRNDLKQPVLEPIAKEPVPQEPDFQCPICRNSLVNACSTICGHVFCQECIMQTVKYQKKCPTCRRKLIKSSFHKLFLPAIA